jgi:hypothetical protein
MSFLTRVRLAIVRWWIRNAELRRRLPGFVQLQDGLDRAPLPGADDLPQAVSPAVPVERKRVAVPARLVIRFDV